MLSCFASLHVLISLLHAYTHSHTHKHIHKHAHISGSTSLCVKLSIKYQYHVRNFQPNSFLLEDFNKVQMDGYLNGRQKK